MFPKQSCIEYSETAHAHGDTESLPLGGANVIDDTPYKARLVH